VFASARSRTPNDHKSIAARADGYDHIIAPLAGGSNAGDGTEGEAAFLHSIDRGVP
jgi:hypothetical protein